MSTRQKITPNNLVCNLLIAAKIALGARGSTTTPEDRERLYQAVVLIEDGMVDEKGCWRLACVRDDDIISIARLLKRASKKRGRK